MVLTIAERAANGEILYAPHLTVEQRRELLVWAKDQGMEYKEIKSKYGFDESESTLRGWKRIATLGNAPREATFTPTDDRLLDQAIRLYATGPLDQENSYTGIWKKVTEYIRRNGGTTTAGPPKLRERWNAISGYNVPPQNSSGGTRGQTGRGSAKSNTPTKPTATAHSTQTNTSQNRPTSSPDTRWGPYPDLSWYELVDALGRKDATKWVRNHRAVEEGDYDVEEEEGEDEDEEQETNDEDDEGDEGEESEEGEEGEEEDLAWTHEEYDNFDVEGEEDADFS